MRGDSERPESIQLSWWQSRTVPAASSEQLEKLIVFPDSSAEALAQMPAGECIESDVFELGGHPWQILLYPGGVDRVSSSVVSHMLCVVLCAVSREHACVASSTPKP